MDAYRDLHGEFLFVKIYLRRIYKRYKDLNSVKWTSYLACMSYTKEVRLDN